MISFSSEICTFCLLYFRISNLKGCSSGPVCVAIRHSVYNFKLLVWEVWNEQFSICHTRSGVHFYTSYTLLFIRFASLKAAVFFSIYPLPIIFNTCKQMLSIWNMCFQQSMLFFCFLFFSFITFFECIPCIVVYNIDLFLKEWFNKVYDTATIYLAILFLLLSLPLLFFWGDKLITTYLLFFKSSYHQTLCLILHLWITISIFKIKVMKNI